MPSIVVTPKYNPFTFDELYRPLAETTKMHMALEDQYNAMEMEVAKLDYLKDSDPEAYATIRNYENTLRGLAGELASKGLTPQSRQGVYDMRKMYSSDIDPINKYVAWKDAQAKSRQAMRDKDSSYMWETPLEDIYYNTWRENPNITFKGASGETLSKDVAESVKYLQNKWTNNPIIEDLSKKYSELKGMFRETEEYGISKEELREFLNGDASEEDKKKVLGVYYDLLNHAINQVAEKHGLNSWKNSAEVENWKKASLENGLWAALGKQGDQFLNAPNGGKGSGKGDEELNPNHPDVIFDTLLGSTDFEGLSYIKNKEEFTSKKINRATKDGTKIDAPGTIHAFTIPPGTTTFVIKSDETFKKQIQEDMLSGGTHILRGADLRREDGTIDVTKLQNLSEDEKPIWGVTLSVSPLIALAYDLEYYTKLAPEKDRLSKEEVLDKYIFDTEDRYTISDVATKDPNKTPFDENDIKLYDSENNKLIGINTNEAEQLLKKRIDEIKANTDAAMFSHARFKVSSSVAKQWLKDTATKEGNEKGELETVKYKYNKEKKDFEVTGTGKKINILDLKDEEIKSVIPYYSPRGMVLKVGTSNGTFYVKAHTAANVKSEIDRQFENIKKGEGLLYKAVLNYLNATTTEDAEKYRKEINALKDSRMNLYTKIQRALAAELRDNESTSTKWE